jgi:hypothetical protein
MGDLIMATSRHKHWYGPAKARVSIENELTDAELHRIALAKLKVTGINGDYPRECCECAECKIGGKRFALHRPSDCHYTSIRGALVSAASRMADECVTVYYGSNGDSANRWTKAFATEMDRLSAQLGL